MRCFLLGLGVCALMASGGCARDAKQRDADFELRRLEHERDQLAEQLRDERARAAALQQRAERAEHEAGVLRAQDAAQRDRLQSLAQDNEKLHALFDSLKTRDVRRPSVPVSPLPDSVDAALAALTQRFPDRLWYDPGRGAVSLANDQLFDPGSDEVRAEARPLLDELAGVFARPELKDHEIIVVGHADASPITKPETLALHPTNWHLSVHRAIAVKNLLVKAGLSAARLGVMGYGEERPVGDDPARNRRVEIHVVRKGDVRGFAPVVPAARTR